MCSACYGLGIVSTALIELILIFTITLGKMCYYFSIMQMRRLVKVKDQDVKTSPLAL